MLRTLVLASAILCCANGSAQAEQYCVGTAAELRTALSNAQASTAASEVRVLSGFYSLPAANPGAVSLQYSGTSALTLTGGWSNTGGACASRPDGPDSTVLSAAGEGRLLSIFLLSGGSTQIQLTNLSFRQGDNSSGANDAACVTVESDVGADGVVLIDRNSFRLCSRATGSGSALVVRARSTDVYVRGNLFVDNASSSGTILLHGLGSSTFYVSNNTIAHNPQFGAGGGPGGLQITSQASDFTWLNNNVLWNNGTGSGYDLLIAANTPIVMNNNLVGDMPPPPASAAESGTLADDPLFVSSNDLRPRAESPMRNSGVNPNGSALAIDFAGGARVQGVRIDRGAFEFPEVFSSGFE